MTETSSSVNGQDPSTPDRAELLGLYKTAIEEYRFEVNLGWDRQKFFVGLNVSLLAALAGFAKLGGEQAHNGPLIGALLADAVTAFAGIVVVQKSHLYYRNARDLFQRIERRLGYATTDLALQTTAGMKEGHDAAPRLARIRTVTLTTVVLGLLAALEVGLAAYHWFMP